MELYGRSVLDNTLHDRIEHRLQKSHSAVWNRHITEDYVEHAPVMSTDRLEKPKPAPPTIEPSNNITNNNSSSINNGSLPRNFSRITIHQKGGGLKRNASMSDVSTKNSFVTQQQQQHHQQQQQQ